MRTTSRRQLLKTTAASAGVLLAARTMPALALPRIELAITPSLTQFGYSQVRLAMGDLPSGFAKPELLAATAVSQTSEDWRVTAAERKVSFGPFGAIGDETYRPYQNIEPARGA